MKYTIFFLLLFTLYCCNTKNEELIVSKTNIALSKNSPKDTTEQVMNLHNNLILTDFFGTYEGILPCSNCEGIETIVSLYKNNTYHLEMDFLGGNRKKISEWGVFDWVDNENNIYFNNKSKMAFKVGEDRIWLVNSLDIKSIKLGNNTNFILQKR